MERTTQQLKDLTIVGHWVRRLLDVVLVKLLPTLVQEMALFLTALRGWNLVTA